MQQLKIAFIGGGNMAEALLAGLLQAGHPAGLISVSDVNSDRLAVLHSQYGVFVSPDNAEVAAAADIIVLAVKPQQIVSAVGTIRSALSDNVTIVSIAAGVDTSMLSQAFGTRNPHLVRVMPNTAALVGAGMSVLFSIASMESKARAEYILAASGETAWVEDEKLLHAVTAISGSGPAYFFLVAEMLQASGVAMGLSATLAQQLAAQTTLGAGSMLVKSGRDAALLRQQVTSPGGTTQAALDAMHEKGLPAAIRAGTMAAKKRSVELGR
ncbi:MAG: pyrroline-5-carboxylate reductase [Mariprofundaceae bacterium]